MLYGIIHTTITALLTKVTKPHFAQALDRLNGPCLPCREENDG